MASQTDPNFGLEHSWDVGESGWKSGMDANLKKLGAIMMLSVHDRDLTAPPGGPVNGDRYIVAAGATGAWAGQDDNIAVEVAGGWDFYTPATGWLAYIEDEAVLAVWTGSAWSTGVAL